MASLECLDSPVPFWREAAQDNVDTNSMCDVALRRLRSDILSGRLEPGTKLVVKDLSESYDIGATPLRDALSELVGTFLVIREAQRGFQVAPVSHRDLADVGHTRKLVEVAALELSMRHADKSWEQRVRVAHVAFLKTTRGIGDDRPIAEDWEETHRAFHFALLSCCNSPALRAMCVNLNDRFDRYRRLALPSRSYTGAVDLDHEPLLEAAISRDVPKAMALLGQHIDDTLWVIRENFVARGDSLNSPSP